MYELLGTVTRVAGAIGESPDAEESAAILSKTHGRIIQYDR